MIPTIEIFVPREFTAEKVCAAYKKAMAHVHIAAAVCGGGGEVKLMTAAAGAVGAFFIIHAEGENYGGVEGDL